MLLAAEQVAKLSCVGVRNKVEDKGTMVPIIEYQNDL